MSSVLSRVRSHAWIPAGVALLALLALRALPASADTFEVHVQTSVTTHVQPSASSAIAGTLTPGQSYIVTDTRVADGATWNALLTPDGVSLGWANAADLEVSTPETNAVPDNSVTPEISASVPVQGEPLQVLIQNSPEPTGFEPNMAP
jgi:hypothetical protein